MNDRLASRSLLMIGIALFCIGIAAAYKIWGS
jgi:hypothetical protein